MASYYEYEELRAAATAPGATQEQIDALGEWFKQYGDRFWNGEYYDADKGMRLYPLYSFDPDYPGQLDIVGFTFDWSEHDASLEACIAAGYDG